MSAALRAELRKLFSTKLWWLLALLLAAYLIFIAVVMAFSVTVQIPGESDSLLPGGIDQAKMIYSLTSPIGYVFPLIIGSLMFTGEFRHKTITASLLVQPSRTVLMGAKLAVAGIVGLFYGIIGTASTVIGSAPILAWRGNGTFLGEREVIELLAMSVVVMVLWAVLGAAVGSVLTNQIAAIIVILAFTQFVEPIARIALSVWDATAEVSKFLPGAAADAIVGSSFYAQGGVAELLGRGAGAAVLISYIVAFALVGRLVTLRRDVG